MGKSEYHTFSIRLRDDVFQRLAESAERMGLNRSQYINYALRQSFNSEDMVRTMPEMMKALDEITNKIRKEIEQ